MCCNSWIAWMTTGVILELFGLGLLIAGCFSFTEKSTILISSGIILIIIGAVFFAIARRIRWTNYLNARRAALATRTRVVRVHYITAVPVNRVATYGPPNSNISPMTAIDYGLSQPPPAYNSLPPATSPPPYETSATSQA